MPSFDDRPLTAPCTEDCTSFAPGHRVHHIQARLSWQPDVVVHPAVVLQNDGDGFLVIETDDDHRRYLLWHHTGIRLSTLVGGSVRYRRRYGVLDIGPGPDGDPQRSLLASVTALRLR